MTIPSLFNIVTGVIILEKGQRKELAKALYDVGKLVLAALVLGQIISGTSIKMGVFVGGSIIFVVTFVGATLLNKGVNP